jgi:hypothetical protein
MELAVGGHAVDLGSRREDHALVILHALADERQVGLEIELKHAQRIADVGRRGCDRHERQEHVALSDVVFDPLAVDRDVALEEMKARMGEKLRHPIGLEVHAVHVPVGVPQYRFAQMMADEAIDPQDEELLHS